MPECLFLWEACSKRCSFHHNECYLCLFSYLDDTGGLGGWAERLRLCGGLLLVAAFFLEGCCSFLEGCCLFLEGCYLFLEGSTRPIHGWEWGPN